MGKKWLNHVKKFKKKKKDPQNLWTVNVQNVPLKCHWPRSCRRHRNVSGSCRLLQRTEPLDSYTDTAQLFSANDQKKQINQLETRLAVVPGPTGGTKYTEGCQSTSAVSR